MLPHGVAGHVTCRCVSRVPAHRGYKRVPSDNIKRQKQEHEGPLSRRFPQTCLLAESRMRCQLHHRYGRNERQQVAEDEASRVVAKICVRLGLKHQRLARLGQS